MLTSLKKFWSDDRGVATVEYALLVSVMVVAGIAAWAELSDTIGNMLVDASGNIATGNASSN